MHVLNLMWADEGREFEWAGFIHTVMLDNNNVQPGDGSTIAHDYIEHVNGLKAIGGFEDELEAFGGMWECRGQHGFISSAKAPEEDMVHDFISLYEYWNGRPLKFKKCRAPILCETFDAIEYYFRASSVKEEEHKPLDTFLEAARHLFESGSRKFERRWKRNKTCPSSLFDAIRDYIDNRLQHEAEFHGQAFKVTVDRNYRVSSRDVTDIY